MSRWQSRRGSFETQSWQTFIISDGVNQLSDIIHVFLKPAREHSLLARPCVRGLASRGSTQPQSDLQKSHQHHHSLHLPIPVTSSHPSQTCPLSLLCCYASFRWVLNLDRSQTLTSVSLIRWCIFPVRGCCKKTDEKHKLSSER